MIEDFKTEYLKLLAETKDKISAIPSDEIPYNTYLKYMDLIEKSIPKDKSDHSYLNGISILKYVLENIDKYDHSDEANYQPIEIKKVPDKNKQIIKQDIKDLKKEIKKSKSLSNKYRSKIIAYLTALIILITAPVVSYNKAKNTPKERLYSTKSEMYTTLEPDIPINYNLLYLNLDKIPSIKTSYEPLNPYYSTVRIVKYNPWEVEGKECQRNIYTYENNATNINISLPLNKTELDNILSTGCNKEREYSYTVKLRAPERDYPEAIYEVIYMVQDVNNYIEKPLEFEVYTDFIILTITELLLLFCVSEMSGEPLINHLLIAIKDLINNKHITKEQKRKLTELLTKYENNYMNHKKRTLKK